ncbi:MAG: hypothetical protein R3Y62_00215 [Eubacteriales bacterium]
MSKFTERFQEIQQEQGFTIAAVCKKAKLERTLVHKMIKGDRHPDKAVLNAFLAKAMLSHSQMQELQTLYEIEVVGEATYRARLQIAQLFSRIDVLSKAQSSVLAQEVDTPVNLDYLGQQQAFQGAFQGEMLFERWAAYAVQNSQQLSLFLPSHCHSFFNALIRIYATTPRTLEIQHIFALEKRHQKASVNLDIFSQLMPLALLRKDGYHPQFFYADTHALADHFTPMPYYCFDEESVLMIGEDFTQVIFSKEPDVLQLYRQHFANTKANTIPFLTVQTSFDNLIQGYHQGDFTGAALRISYEAQPCIGQFITRELVDSYVNQALPQREFLVDSISKMYMDMHTNAPLRASFFSDKGLHTFATTGVVRYFPTSIVPALRPDTRVYFLQCIKDSILRDEQSFYAIKESSLCVPDLVSCEVFEGGHISFHLNDSHFPHVFYMSESSVVDALMDFFHSLKTAPTVYGKEETLDLIDTCIQLAQE